MRYDVTSLPTIVFLSPDGPPALPRERLPGPGQFPRTLEAAQAIARRVIAWEDALRTNPNDAAALAALGAHLYEQEYFEDAATCSGAPPPIDADEPVDDRRRTRMLLAILENMDRNYAEAEKLVKEALALGPRGEDNPKLLFVLGRTYVSWGRHAEGVATMEIIVRDYPQSPIAQKARETIVNLGPR